MMSLTASTWRTVSPCRWGSSLNSAVAARSWNGSLLRPEVRVANWRRKPAEALLKLALAASNEQLLANPADSPVLQRFAGEGKRIIRVFDEQRRRRRCVSWKPIQHYEAMVEISPQWHQIFETVALNDELLSWSCFDSFL